MTLQAEASGIFFGQEKATSECFRTEITYRTEQGPQKCFTNRMPHGCIYMRAQINALGWIWIEFRLFSKFNSYTRHRPTNYKYNQLSLLMKAIQGTLPCAFYKVTTEINKTGEVKSVPEYTRVSTCAPCTSSFWMLQAVTNRLFEHVNVLSIIQLCIFFSGGTLNLSHITTKMEPR